MAETTETREEREARWWREWFAADYSWDGLAGHDIEGGGQFGEKTLQDYWRRDPVTGEARTDAELRTAGELVEFDGRWWHLAHLPPHGDCGGESWKADLAAAQWASLGALLTRRLAVARETLGKFSAPLLPERSFWPSEDRDDRARFDGAVLKSFPRSEVKQIFMSCRRVAILSGEGLSNTVFGSGVDFAGALFLCDARFEKSAFSGSASFYGAIFAGITSFYGAIFSGDVLFDRAVLFGRGRFDRASFGKPASFVFATFSGSASFDPVTFSGSTDFQSAAFSRDANFNSASFSDSVRFDDASFSGEAGFGATVFSGNARFDRAKFEKGVHFSGRFLSSATFESAQFEQPVRFSAAIDSPERDFSRAFYNSHFMVLADFSGAVAPNEGARMAAAFAEAQFEKALVLTDGLDGKQGRDLHKAILANTRAAAKDAKELDAAFSTLESGCRVVKIAMGRARDEVREQAYYRLQLRARHQRRDIEGWEKFIGWIYGFASGFGYSLSRPLVLLVFVTALCGQLYAVWGASLLTGRFTPIVSESFAFQGQGVALSALKPFSALEAPKPLELKVVGAASPVAPLGAQRTLVGVLTENPAVALGLRLATMAQVIISTLLIFLFGLAVKRRFQIS